MTKLRAMQCMQRRHFNLLLQGRVPTKDRLDWIARDWREVQNDQPAFDIACEQLMTMDWPVDATLEEIKQHWKNLAEEYN